MARVNYVSVSRKITRAMARGSHREEIRDEAESTFENAKEDFLNEVESHPTSNKVAGDPYTIGYFGFEEWDDPVSDFVRHMDQNITMGDRPRIYQRGPDEVEIRYFIKYPLDREIYEDKDLAVPWLDKTWVQLMVEGIHNIQYFLFGENKKKSRSGYGVQSDYKVSSTSVEPKDHTYLTVLKNRFRDILRGR